MKRRTLLALALAEGAAFGAEQHHGRLTPARLALRASLLAEGEAALARRDVPTALSRFERAALIAHSPDTELGLVRCYMQGGEYRRALAFGAHTAGAHLDEPAGAAVYAWLLHAGGQEALAHQLLAQSLARTPQHPLLRAVSRALREPWPVAGAALLAPPARLAPYGETVPGAQAVVSGTLVRAGRAALVPAGALRSQGRYWVRNGLGDTVAARPANGISFEGLAELVLERPLPAPALAMVARDPFPGSVAMAVEFAPQADTQPAWPLLKTGFVGAAMAAAGQRQLGVSLPTGGRRGGPVFNQQGAWVGVALAAPGGDRLLCASRLRRWAGANLAAAAPDGPADPAAVDSVYEASLRSALQVLRA